MICICSHSRFRSQAMSIDKRVHLRSKGKRSFEVVCGDVSPLLKMTGKLEKVTCPVCLRKYLELVM